MPAVTIRSGLEIDTERLGDPDGPSLVMVMGLGAQRTWWPPELLDGLADEGFDVITFDNRDAGLSTGFDDLGPVPTEVMLARLAGDVSSQPPYVLADLATDVVQLMDELDVDRAHVVGASMGGMIAQHVAFTHPDRVASLTSIMSNAGAADSGQPTPEAMEVLLAPPPADRAAYVDMSVRAARIIGSRTHVDDERQRRQAGEWFDRAHRPEGISRQLMAILSDGDRTDRLAGVEAPTLVVHGTDDTLIQPDGGEATAAAIPGARLELVDDMGHDFPVPLIEHLVTLVAEHVRTAEAG